MDPKRNAGTCTKAECPMCKPKSCCGKHHKHYVYNTESMEGVCVRHNNDCTAVCVPQKPDPTKKRVCSKGCNRMLKVSKAKPKPGASTDAGLFDIVVCQVDHRIVCDPWSTHGSKMKKKESPCRTTKWVKPVARCVDFDAGVWNAGPTCMANAANAPPTLAPTPAPTPSTRRRRYTWVRRRAPKKKKIKPKAVLGCTGVASAAMAKISMQCKPATKTDNTACKPFAESLAEYY